MPIEIGSVFTRWTVLLRSEGRDHYLCRCACGAEKRVRADHLRLGTSKSCGCLHKELVRARSHVMHAAAIKHGQSGTRAYSTWLGIRQRCNNPNNRAYKYYGGRGIVICERWQDFANFFADMGQPPPRHTIERINNDGPYSPGNCRWATRRDQMRNQGVTRKITIDGRTYIAADLADITGLKTDTIIERAALDLPLAEVVSPERRVHRTGLALGGKANGARLLARTHCIRGHAYTEENTQHNGKQRNCRTCLRDRAREVRAYKRR